MNMTFSRFIIPSLLNQIFRPTRNYIKPPSTKRRLGNKLWILTKFMSMAPKYNKVSVDDLLGSSTSGDSNHYRQAALNAPEFKIECNFSGCKRKFPTEEALQAHKRRAHAAPTSYKCPICHSTFSSAQNRNKHVSPPSNVFYRIFGFEIIVKQ